MRVELASAIVRNSLVITPDTTVMEAITEMSGVRALCQISSEAHGKLSVEIEARSSCVVIVENHQPIGILTERDVVRLITQKASLENLPVCDVMTRNLITLRESELSDLFVALELLRKHKIRHLLIVDEHDGLVGLLTHESLRQVSRPVDLLRLRVTEEVMTTEVVCAEPHTAMQDIAGLMIKHPVSSVVIVQTQFGEEQETLKTPIGIVTERDIIQFQALGLDFESSQVQSVMSTPIFSVQPDESLWVVHQMMEQYRTQRLVVTDPQGGLRGIVTQTSLLQALNPLELYNLAQVLEKKVLRLEAEKIQILENRTTSLEQQVEERTTKLKAKVERERLIATISRQIRSSLDLPDILNTTVEEVQKILGCDRVVLWHFQPDLNLLSVAESNANGNVSQPGQLVCDPCFVPDWFEAYRRGRVRVVPDIYTTEMADCHRELLEQLHIRAKILIPILQGDTLWGLLEAIESHAPRQWQPEEVELLEQLATQLAIAIQQASTHQQLQEELQERQQLIAQLQESEQRYVTLTSMAPVGIFRTDTHGYCTYTNERWHQISGLTQEQAFGSEWQQGLHPEDRGMVATEWYQATQENRPFSLEYRFQRFDGAVTWVYGQSVAERDGNGDLVGYVGTITNISDRKQAEIDLHQLNQTLEARVTARTQELQAREAQLFDLFDNATDLIQRVSPEGKLLFVNRAWRESLGYSDHELEQLSIFQIIHPSDLEHCQAMMARIFAGEPCLGIETRFLTKDGKEIIVQGNVNCQFQDGQASTTRGIFRDISDQKQAELELKESQRFLQTVLNSFPLAVFWKDRESVMMGCNQLFAQMSQLESTEAVVGKTNFDFSYTEAEARQYSGDDQQVMRSGIPKLGIEETITLPTGETRWAEVNKIPLRDLEGNVIGVLGTFQDITERVENKKKLEELTDRLTLALKSGEIGCWVWDIAHNTLTWDERMYKLYGVPYQSNSVLTYNHWVNGLHPQDFNRATTLIQQAVAGEAEYDLEFRVIHPDGSIRFIQAYGVMILDAQGNPQRMIGANFNITAQKQAEKMIRQQIEKETVLRQITQRIRETLDLQRIFDTACQDIRHFIQSDRVSIFRFYPDSGFDDGEFVAESVQDGLSSVLAIQVHDHCFGEDYAQRYTEGHFQAVNDVLKSDLQDCHKAVLTQFQIRANLVMPLLLGKKLWGLLCIHACTAPRIWQADEIDLIQQITGQLAIAIQQGDLYNQIQAELIIRQRTEEKIVLELRRKQLLGEIIQSVRDSLDITEILVNVTHKIQEILNSERVIVFQLFPDGRSKIVEESVSDEFPSLKNLHWEDEVWSQEILDCYWQGIPRIVPDVMNDRWTDCLVEYSTQGQIQSKIVAPILQEISSQEDHRWVSSENRNRLWGVLVVHACGKKRVWQNQEAEILQQVADQLAIAIQQADLFERLQQKQKKLTQTNEALALSNEDLARATRLKDEFLANMSHELRTPLNAILGMTEGLEEEVFGTINQKQVKALQTIEKSGLHLLSLINDILDVAKIGSVQVELEYSSVSVTHLCSSSLVFIKQQALQKRIRLETKFAPDLTNAFVDERRIRQVLINLLTNAVKFTPERGTVKLTASRLPQADDATQQHYLRIAVLDTGIGIAPENINKLFQPFVQIDSALNRQYTGTGLGLALVKKIVELHGGRVGLTSELGVGSCFTIDLPYKTELPLALNLPMTGQDDISSMVSEAPLTAPLILLAEDNEATISTISSYLTAKGYRIISAKNGEEAIAMIYSESPDLILMDVQMPEMDGLEAMRQLRQDPNLGKIPIIALTALAMSGDRERCLEAGANDYLSKPVRLKELASIIHQLL